MTSIHQKHEILESLNSLDQSQAEKVLEYIKGLLYTTPDEASHKKLKQEAMKEIRKALLGKENGRYDLLSNHASLPSRIAGAPSMHCSKNYSLFNCRSEFRPANKHFQLYFT